jgi:D-glycero-alpha-D-manno-heptose-7-phosphate kinase
VATDQTKQDTLVTMVKLTYQLRDELHRNNVLAMGEFLHENWLLKKSLTSGISAPHIDDWYARALGAGATGGKLLGAGAGGFLMFFAPPERHPAIRGALPELREIGVGFEPLGSKIIFYH